MLQSGLKLCVDGLPHVPEHRLRGRVLLEIQVFQPDRAQLQALSLDHRVPVAHDQLDRASAHVHHQRGPIAQVHAMPDTQVDQAGLLLAGDHPRRQSGLPRHLLEKLPAVSRLAHSARGHGLDPLVAFVTGERGEGSDHLQAARHCRVRQATDLEGPVAQTGHVLEPVQDLVGGIRLDFGENQMNRVSADVQNGQLGHEEQLRGAQRSSQLEVSTNKSDSLLFKTAGATTEFVLKPATSETADGPCSGRLPDRSGDLPLDRLGQIVVGVPVQRAPSVAT